MPSELFDLLANAWALGIEPREILPRAKTYDPWIEEGEVESFYAHIDREMQISMERQALLRG